MIKKTSKMLILYASIHSLIYSSKNFFTEISFVQGIVDSKYLKKNSSLLLFLQYSKSVKL